MLAKLKTKKGQGDVVAWVLLVGFAVSLAVLVGRWSLQQSQEATEGIVSMSETDLRCDSIAVNALCTKLSENNYQVKVQNKGTLKIAKLSIGGCDKKEYAFSGGLGLGLNKQEAINLNNCGKTIIIIPLIYIDDRVVGCSAKEITIETDKCTQSQPT